MGKTSTSPARKSQTLLLVRGELLLLRNLNKLLGRLSSIQTLRRRVAVEVLRDCRIVKLPQVATFLDILLDCRWATQGFCVAQASEKVIL